MNEYTHTLGFYVSSEDLPSVLYLPPRTIVYMKDDTILIKLEDANNFSKVGIELDELNVDYQPDFKRFTFEINYSAFLVPKRTKIFK